MGIFWPTRKLEYGVLGSVPIIRGGGRVAEMQAERLRFVRCRPNRSGKGTSSGPGGGERTNIQQIPRTRYCVVDVLDAPEAQPCFSPSNVRYLGSACSPLVHQATYTRPHVKPGKHWSHPFLISLIPGHSRCGSILPDRTLNTWGNNKKD